MFKGSKFKKRQCFELLNFEPIELFRIMSKRSTALRSLAYKMGMEYYAEDDWRMISLMRDFRLFKRGGRKRITNILRKTDEMMEDKINIFDYQYTVSTGKSARTFKQTVFFIQSKQLGLPEFWMKPENFLHTIGAWLGFEDIDFEDYPEFSKQYLLKGTDEDYIRYTLNDSFLKFFTVEKDWSVEGINYFLILYKRRKLLSPREVKSLYRKGMKVFDMIKDK